MEKKDKTVAIRFRKTTPNLEFDRKKFNDEISNKMEEARQKLATNQGLNPLFMMTYNAKSLRDRVMQEMGIKHYVYQAGKTYKMSRAEAELYLSQTDKFRDDDNGQSLDPKIYPKAFRYLVSVEKPIAFIVEQ